MDLWECMLLRPIPNHPASDNSPSYKGLKIRARCYTQLAQNIVRHGYHSPYPRYRGLCGYRPTQSLNMFIMPRRRAVLEPYLY